MRKTVVTLVIVVVLAIIVLALGPFYVLSEGEQAVVTRFGKIVDSQTDAGLKFKMPVVDTVIKYSEKILTWDGDPQRLPTAENQFIWVDTTARWKISDLENFYASVNTMERAYSRLDDVIDSSVRTVIARNNLVEAVRNSNVILEKPGIMVPSGEITELSDFKELASASVDQEKISKGREKLSEDIFNLVQTITPQYGIELVDIVIRQIRYSDDLTESVYERMIKERNQIAEAYRSLGEGKKSEWLGKLDNEQRTILSEAYATSEEIKGQADAQSTQIYSQAYEGSAEFYEFWRTIESYKKVLPNFKKTFSTDMDYFKYLYSAEGNR